MTPEPIGWVIIVILLIGAIFIVKSIIEIKDKMDTIFNKIKKSQKQDSLHKEKK
jgi:hypothetical protein